MKKLITILLSGMLVLSLAGCRSAPSDDKIKDALAEGKITIEDAKSKGWIDDKWIKANYNPVKGKSKIYLFDPFETTYLDGTPASSSIIEGEMCLVFFNTQQEDTLEKLKIYNDVSGQMKELGVPILGIITDPDVTAAKEKLADIKFPVIVYNDAMQKSMERHAEMIDTNIVSVFTKDGGFCSAWCNDETTESLLDYAKDTANEE